jgi:hypothetical protein
MCIASRERTAESDMTSIGATASSSYSSTYATILANLQRNNAGSGAAAAYGGGNSNATTVTLSEAAKAAMASKDFAAVIADARATMDRLLGEAQKTSPLKDGKLDIDLSKVDRRELYAMSVNGEQKFTVDEQKAAKIELQARFDQALAGPTSVGRVTGKIDGLYTAALAFLDQAGAEEKASAAYADARSAIEQMIAKLKTDPGTLPGTFPGDPVADYMQRLAAGETGAPRAIGDVGSDARATLDAQYAAGGTVPDYADFDSRSLAAVAINTGDEFSAEEVQAAKAEMRGRSGAALLSALKNSDSTNPAAFSENVISLFGAMSSEERAAAGWSDNLYAAAVASYQTTSKLASMIGSATGSSIWGGNTASASSSGESMSLLSYL